MPVCVERWRERSDEVMNVFVQTMLMMKNDDRKEKQKLLFTVRLNGR